MSTKVESFGGENFELYKEWPEEDCVFLALEGFYFDAGKNKITVQIPGALWEVLRTYPGCNTELAQLDDKALFERAEKIVDEHIAKWEKLSAEERKPELWNSHLHDAGNPRKEQLRSQMERLLADRDEQQAVLRQIAAYKDEISPEATKKRDETRRHQWKKLDVQIQRRKAAEEQRYAEQQALHKKIIDRLLAKP